MRIPDRCRSTVLSNSLNSPFDWENSKCEQCEMDFLIIPNSPISGSPNQFSTEGFEKLRGYYCIWKIIQNMNPPNNFNETGP